MLCQPRQCSTTRRKEFPYLVTARLSTTRLINDQRRVLFSNQQNWGCVQCQGFGWWPQVCHLSGSAHRSSKVAKMCSHLLLWVHLGSTYSPPISSSWIEFLLVSDPFFSLQWAKVDNSCPLCKQRFFSVVLTIIEVLIILNNWSYHHPSLHTTPIPKPNLGSDTPGRKDTKSEPSSCCQVAAVPDVSRRAIWIGAN